MTAIANQGWQNIEDQNGVFADGYAPVAHSHTDDRRMGAAWSYLTAGVRRRPNLSIMGEVDAERIVFEGARAVGVQARRGHEPFEVRAREVIVSGGALQSPALLLRSGIGPARELARHNITVNHLLPGMFDTDRLRNTTGRMAKMQGKSDAQMSAERKASVPAKRFGEARELGEICAFLCSLQAGYITGQSIIVDGGLFNAV